MASSFNYELRQFRNTLRMLIDDIMQEVEAGTSDQTDADVALRLIGNAFVQEMYDRDVDIGPISGIDDLRPDELAQQLVELLGKGAAIKIISESYEPHGWRTKP